MHACFSVKPSAFVNFPASYVEQNKTGICSLGMTFLRICLIESVLSILDIPSLLANSEDNVLLPVPDAPPNRTITERRFDITSQAMLKSIRLLSPVYPCFSNDERAMDSKAVVVKIIAGMLW